MKSNFTKSGTVEEFVTFYDNEIGQVTMIGQGCVCYFTRDVDTAVTGTFAKWKILLTDDKILFAINGYLIFMEL